MTDWHRISQQIASHLGQPLGPTSAQPTSGGCINRAYILHSGHQRFFVKLNHASQLAMFAAESAGLLELARSNSLRTPRPICHGISGHQAYLVLEYLDLDNPGNPARAGEQLAALHQHQAAHYGWHQDNTIGSTPQPNGWMDKWSDFWRTRRLGHQLQLAARNGHTGPVQQRGRLLLEQLPQLLDHQPPPSLLHGDLWGGNLAYCRDGQPVIFDPAVYFGDPETDLAMTELFGGFPPAFYHAYHHIRPALPGYAVRKTLYNLYHILNHLNLFGGSYGPQALSMTNQLLAELGH